MGRQIIKQPNGKYCLFSSNIDNITDYDLTADQIIDLWAIEAKEEIAEKVNGIINKLEKGEKPYYQFTNTYESMLSIIKEVHGKKQSIEIQSLIEKKINKT